MEVMRVVSISLAENRLYLPPVFSFIVVPSFAVAYAFFLVVSVSFFAHELPEIRRLSGSPDSSALTRQETSPHCLF